MNRQDIDAKIGEAWKVYREGQNEAAIERFLELIEESPDNVDAYWGLGLSYRNSGDRANAVDAFRKVKELVTVLLENETGESERYFMLNRMVDQQIEQMEDFLRK